MCQALIPHAQIAFDTMIADQAVDDAKVILRWIIKKKELVFKRSECHKTHHGRFRKVERLIAALDVLRGWNTISEVDQVKTDNSKKPILLHHVNPKIFREVENGWRDFKTLPNVENADFIPQNTEQIPQIPHRAENKSKELSENDTIAVPAYFNELEREYFLNLVDFMESPKYQMGRATAEREAKAIVDQYREMKKARTHEK